MSITLLLLTLLVTVPQNTLLPLISLGLAEEAPVLGNNGQSLANLNADIPFSNSHINTFAPTPFCFRDKRFLTTYMLSMCTKRGSIISVLITIYFLKLAEFIELIGSVRRNHMEEVPHLQYTRMIVPEVLC